LLQIEKSFDSVVLWIMKHKPDYLLGIVLAGCLALALAFPGDVPWINDEPVFIGRALHANTNGRLAHEGLRGMFGLRYGPVAIWVYQGLLLVSQNPVHLSMMKNFLTLALLVGGLVYFRRHLGLPKWPILLVFFSPYIYFYNRLLWDNVWIIPLSLLLWCALLGFWQQGGRWYLLAAMTIALVLVHIHLMALLVVVPISLSILIFDRRWLRSHPTFSGLCALLALAACLPYLRSTIPDATIALSQREGFFESLLAGLSGAGLFSFLHFGDYFIPEIYGRSFFIDAKLTRMLVSLSALVFLPWLIGMLGGAGRLIKKQKAGEPCSVADRLTAVALMSIATYTAFFVVTGHPHHPHYGNSVWFAYFLIIWQGIDIGMRAASPWIKGVLAVQMPVLAAMLTMTVLFIHRNGGNQGIHYGPTTATQINVVRTILRYSPRSRIYHAVPNYHHFPHAFYTLVALLRPANPEPERPVRYIYIEPERNHLQGFLQVRVLEQPLSTQSVQPLGMNQDP
jgi:hypothetical protein